MKKFLSLLALVILFVSFNSLEITFAATNPEVYDVEQGRIIEKQMKAIQNYEKIIEKGDTYVDFENEYSGVYINEDDQLVINTVRGSAEKFMENIDISDDVVIVEVKYSLNKLEEEFEILKLHALQLGITTVSLSQRFNTLKITFEQYNIDNVDSLKQLVDLDNLIIEYNKGVSDFTTQYAINGESLYGDDAGTWRGQTIGYAASDNNGDPGVVTAGHIILYDGINYGEDIRYNSIFGNKMGDLHQYCVCGSVDAAFVELRDNWYNNWLPTHNFMNGDTYTGVSSPPQYLVEGLNLYMYGATSGKTAGEITALTTYRVLPHPEGGTIILQNQIEADYESQVGDSGAAVTFWMYAGYTSYRMVMGIQSNTYWDAGMGNWNSDSRSYFSTVSAIHTYLLLTSY